MNTRIALASLLAAITLAGCEGLRDALTAHTETAARVERQELTATRLADLAGNSRVELGRDVVRALADVWVNYQLLGVAAARGDSLAEPALVDSAMWSLIAGNKARRLYERVSANWGRVDTAAAPNVYAAGDLLSADHILLMTQNQPDSVKRTKLARIRALRQRVNAVNFAQLAREHSEDRGSAQQGGRLGVFPRGIMVPEFERTLIALQPRQISDIIETQFGYHIIRRPAFAEIRAQFLEESARLSVQRAESLYTARMDTLSRVRLKKDAPAKARAAARDTDAHRDDRTVLATHKAGSFPVSRFVQWLETFSPQQNLPARIQGAPDSAVEGLLRNFVRNDLVLRSADSAGIRLTPEEIQQVRQTFAMRLEQAWLGLGIHPRVLADSAATPLEREQLAARKVEQFIEAMLQERVQYVPVLPQIEWALMTRYDARVNPAGVDRALQLATRVRSKADSVRAAQRPPSVVPVPGQQGQPEEFAAPQPQDTAARR
jgi:peptidyl-prolyl cis-trans isomerase D